MLDTRSISSFIILADELHFGRAAERLGIAQSALSKHIKRLEDQLGAPLLTRGRRTAVRLTQTGETFLKEARHAITGLERAERIGRLAARGEAGPLHIGYIFSAAICGLLARALGIAHDRYPALDVQADMRTTPDQLAALADGRIDIGLTRPRPAYPHALAAHRIHSEDLVLLMSSSNHLAARTSISPDELAGEHFLTPSFEDGSGLIDNQRRLATAGGFAVSRNIEVKDFITAAAMAAGGYGIVLAPRSMTGLHLGGLTVVEIDGYTDRVETMLVYRPETAPPLVAAIREILEC